MSLLVIQLPPRERLRAVTPGAVAPSPLQLPATWSHTLSTDGQTAQPLKRAAAADLPKADRVVLVLSAADVSWHRVLLPKANASRMRAALAGVLEEHILDDDESVHLALAPDVEPGQESWVAATHGARLKAALDALREAGVQVQQVVPAMPTPGGPLRGHFATQEVGSAAVPGGADPSAAPPGAAPPFADTQPAAIEVPCWSLSKEDGVWHLPLRRGPEGTAISTLAIALRDELPAMSPGHRWTTTPAAANVAQRFMGRPVAVQSEADHLLEAAQSPMNLRQFDLLQGQRGLRLAGDLARQFGTRPWRPVHLGVGALVVMHLIGVNVYAWKQNQDLQARRDESKTLLSTTFPSVRVVLDAPVQMRTEVERLRAAAGQPGPGDLEVALATVAAAWPEGKGPVSTLRYQSRQLMLAATDWRDDEVAAFKTRLGAAGWTVSFADGVLTVAHSRAAKEAP